MPSIRQAGAPPGGEVVGRRLRSARRLRGLSQKELAEKIGTSQNQVSTIERERSGTSLRTAAATARALNVSIDYLVGWAADPTPPTELKAGLGEALARLADLDADAGAGPGGRFNPADGDFVAVDEIIASPGSGGNVIDERIIGRVKFPGDWLKARGLEARLCRVIRVRGESMEPTLPDGAAVLVDLDGREPRDRGIFLVRIGDELPARRFSRDPRGGWLLKSDNPDKRAWPTLAWPDGARIVGEVRWMGRSFG